MSRSIGVAIPLSLVLLTFLAFIACSPEPANVNKPAANVTDSAQITAATFQPPQCNPSSPASNRANDMSLHFAQHRTGDPDLERQRQHGAFRVDFVTRGNRVILRLVGRISANDQPGGAGPKPTLKTLMDRLDWYLKKGCADEIRFSDDMAASSMGFEWIICGDGQVSCPDGSCAAPGSCPMKRTDPPANSNANVNSNATREPNPSSNSNSDSNSNSRTGP